MGAGQRGHMARVAQEYCYYNQRPTWTGISRPSPAMIVAGTLTNKMAPALRKVYDQMGRTALRDLDGILRQSR